MGQACGAENRVAVPDGTFPRKRNCVLGVTEEHTLDLTESSPIKQIIKQNRESNSPAVVKTFSEEYLSDEGDDGWSVGNRCVVKHQHCCLREAPRADATQSGIVKPWMTVVIMKLVEDDGRLWAFVDPPVAEKGGPPPGWAILEGEDCDANSKLCLKKLDLSWEVGRVYKAREGTILRSGMELTSQRVGSLQKDDKAEVLELQMLEGECKTRLRAKVLIWRTRETGWLSPRSKDGLHLLKRFKVQKLEMSGRLAQAAPKSRRGGA